MVDRIGVCVQCYQAVNRLSWGKEIECVQCGRIFILRGGETRGGSGDQEDKHGAEGAETPSIDHEIPREHGVHGEEDGDAKGSSRKDLVGCPG